VQKFDEIRWVIASLGEQTLDVVEAEGEAKACRMTSDGNWW
jgi:hypothetical protein